MFIRKTRIALLLVGLASTGAAGAQDTLRVEVELVNLVATVTDAEGRYVTGLDMDDFLVEDDGVPQEIAHFSEDTNIPVTMGIALDTSGSMVERMRTALAALGRFVESLHPEDEIFVTTFSSRVSLIENLTTDRDQLSEALLRVDVSGGTALYDALADSLERVRSGRHDKRAVVVLTDGSDTTSKLRLSEVLESVRGSDALVYAMGIDTLRFADEADHVSFEWPLSAIPGVPGVSSPRWIDEPVDIQVLNSFAEASGGKAYQVSGTWTDGIQEEVDNVLDEVAAELRSQYTLGYYPSSPGDGRFHQISVRVEDRTFTVRTRNGYRSPAPAP